MPNKRLMEPNRAAPQRKDSDAAASRDRILDVAEQLFAERGFAATSMRHIAQGAGVNVATLYYHCGSKDELFVSIYSRVIERMTSWVTETFQAGAPFRTLVASLIDRVVEFLAQHPSIPRLLLRSDLGELPSADADKRQVYRPLLDMVTRVMQPQIDQGHIRPIDVRTFVQAATGVIIYVAMGLNRGQDLSAKTKVNAKQLKTAQRHARMFILGALGLDPEAP